MQRFHHLGGMTAIALTALGLSACYPPPPATVAAAPPGAATQLPPYYVPSDVATALPPQPQPYVPPTATNPPYPLTGAAGPQPYGPTTWPGGAIPSNAGTTLVSVAPFARPRRAWRPRHRRPRRWQFGNQATGAGAVDSMFGSPGNTHSGPRQARTGSLDTGSKGQTAGPGPKAAGRREGPDRCGRVHLGMDPGPHLG